MKKVLRITISLVLALALISPVAFVTAAAVNDALSGVTSKAEKTFYNIADAAIKTFLSGMVRLMPEIGWKHIDDFTFENFYEGSPSFADRAEAQNEWCLGYASASLIPSDLATKGYSLGGYFNIPQIKATSVADDQAVRVVAIDDNSGRGISIFAVIDGAGISDTDVGKIRKELESFAAANNIISINVSVTHAHSAIDTQGLSANLPAALFLNPLINKLNLKFALFTGVDPDFMASVITKTANTIRTAVGNMTAGQLYYSSVDISELIRDKREPIVYDTNMNRLRFVPFAADKKEIWIANSGIHPTSLSRDTTAVSSDFIYYIEEYIRQNANADFIFVQGAQAALTSEKSPIAQIGDTPYDAMVKYGREIGRRLVSINALAETEIEPYFNIKFAPVFIPVDNYILLSAAKVGIVTNSVVYTGNKKTAASMATELAYAEFGDTLAVALIPGELTPEIAFGGAYSASESWTGKDWEYPSMASLVAPRKLIVFGLMNNSVGYIMADNDYGSFLADGHYEETVSAGLKSGSSIMEVFQNLVESVR